MMRLLWGAALAVVLAASSALAADRPSDFDNWLHARPLSTTLGAGDEMPVRQGGETRRLFPLSSFMRPDGSNAILPNARTGIFPNPTLNNCLVGTGTDWASATCPGGGGGGGMDTSASNAVLPGARTSLGASVSGGVWPGSLGGTGVANTGRTITLGGNLVSGGALTSTGTGPTTLAFPSGSATFTFPTSSKTLLASDASNATLPDARTNLGLGAASDVTFNSLAAGGATLTPGGATLNRALSATQTPAGTLAAGPYGYSHLNLLTIASDAVNTGRMFGLGVDWTCCLSSARGERFGIGSVMRITGASNAADPNPFYIGSLGVVTAHVNAPNSLAGVYGGNFNVALDPGVTGWAQISAAELDVTVLAGANPLTKIALPIVLGPNDAVQGSAPGGDAAISFYSHPTSAIGWKNLLLLDQQAGHGKTIGTTGCVLCTVGTITMATGIDLSGTTITGDFLKGPGDFSVSGAGYLRLKRDQSIQFANSSGSVIRNFARLLNASDTIAFGDTDNSGSAPVTFNFATGAKVSISNTTGTTSATTGSLVTAGGLGVGGGITAQGYVGSIFNSGGVYPTSQAVGSWSIGNNFSMGQNEVTLWNTVNGAGGIDFRQKTGAGASTQLAGMTTTAMTVPLATASTSPTSGALIVTGGLGVGGALHAASLNVVGAISDNGAAPTGTAGSGYARKTAPAFNGMSLASGTLTGVPTPVNPGDAVNKAFADSILAGIFLHDEVKAASKAEDGNISATYANGASGVGATLTNSGAQAAFALDGYSGIIGDRFLIKDQTLPQNNGIYTLTTVGSGATNWVLTRATDFDANGGGEVTSGAAFSVLNGTVGQINTLWVETGQGPFTIGTTSITFSKIVTGAGGSGAVNAGTPNQLGYYAGAGTTISGLDTANNGVLATNGSGIPAITSTLPNAVKDLIDRLGTVTSGTWQGTAISPSKGGTGTDLTATGGTNQVVQQVSPGAALTVGQLAASSLSNGVTGSGAIMLAAGGALTGVTGMGIRDTSAAFDVTIAAVSAPALSAGRTLTIDMSNVAHTLDLGPTSNTIAFPNTASYTLVGSQDTGTVTNTMLAGSIAATKLVGSDIATVGTIASGTWNATAIGITKGGSGVATIADDQVVVGTGANTAAVTTLPNCVDTGGNHLNYTTATNAFSCGTSGGSGGSGGSGLPPTQQRFTTGTAQTYTTPVGANLIVATVCAGGGGGGGTGATTGTVGATGTTSTFNSINAIGGTGGGGTITLAGGAGGAGGTGGTGTATWRVPGKIGEQAKAGQTGDISVPGGGGFSLMGTIASGGIGAFPNSATRGAGGGGGAGECYSLRITSPAATYTYTVGGGGAGGTATGTGATAGSPGLAGVIQVEEFYPAGGNDAVTSGISAAGTTQGTATVLTAAQNYVSTAAVDSGVRLPAGAVGGHIFVINETANQFLIYPISGSAINSLSVNTPILVQPDTTAHFIAKSTTVWRSVP